MVEPQDASKMLRKCHEFHEHAIRLANTIVNSGAEIFSVPLELCIRPDEKSVTGDSFSKLDSTDTGPSGPGGSSGASGSSDPHNWTIFSGVRKSKSDSKSNNSKHTPNSKHATLLSRGRALQPVMSQIVEDPLPENMWETASFSERPNYL
jgi:hypothetical protein